MFLFILDGFCLFYQSLKIQIHLMFLFINQYLQETFTVKEIQIHLMFLFIRYWCSKGLKTPEFKYISCSYLSLTCHLHYTTHSNTSHVLIYRGRGYCCNWFSDIQIHLMFLFIKIFRFISLLR